MMLQQLGATFIFIHVFATAMTIAPRSALKFLLHGLSWLMLGIAGLAFWVGGRAIHEFGKVDRLLAELLGLSIAVVTGALGFILKSTAEGVDDAAEPRVNE